MKTIVLDLNKYVVSIHGVNISYFSVFFLCNLLAGQKFNNILIMNYST